MGEAVQTSYEKAAKVLGKRNEKKGKRKNLKRVQYFGGIYEKEENEKFWKKVKKYIENSYKIEGNGCIYFQSDGAKRD